MASNHKRNTTGLMASVEAKQINAEKKVDLAIRSLVQDQKAVNFNSVALHADVSKTFLYSNLSIRERIEMLRKQQNNRIVSKKKLNMSESSKDILLAAKNKRIKELENENKRIKQELVLLRGMIYENKK